MKNIVKIVALSAISLSFNAYADLGEAEMIKQINKFMQEGYEFIPPTPKQEKEGLIGIYHKINKNKNGGSRILSEEEARKIWSNADASIGMASVPDVHGKAGKGTAVHSYHRSIVVNESGRYVCIKLMENLSAAPGVSHDEIHHACVNPGQRYDVTSDVWLNVQYAKGNHALTATLNIQDYPPGIYQGYGTAFIK